MDFYFPIAILAIALGVGLFGEKLGIRSALHEPVIGILVVIAGSITLFGSLGESLDEDRKFYLGMHVAALILIALALLVGGKEK